jgi:histidyl-tRNA synthetase
MSEGKKIKPSLSKGTRDFLPSEVAKRNYIFDTIKSVFRKYGFEQIETPAIERLETLTGKYGEEGDKLLFKILNSGNPFQNLTADELRDLDKVVANETVNHVHAVINLGENEQQSELKTKKKISEYVNKIAEKGLRYDLTVPLARYVVQHQEDLAFPFKRFHIGPVWRADRPQKGRYQEFYQCDADVIGSTSLLNEVELTKIYVEVFNSLGVKVIVNYNHRKVFDAIAERLNVGDKLSEFTTIIDKLDKIQWPGVLEELRSKLGFTENQIAILKNELHSGINLQPWFQENKSGRVAHKDLNYFFDSMNVLSNYRWSPNEGFIFENANVLFNPTLARGLSYYTGIIWEVGINWKDEAYSDVKMGSIASGGRYDNLTEMFGGQNMSGVGISFGIERIYDVMEELNLFPETIAQGVKVLFVPRDANAEDFAFQQTQTLRDAGIAAEMFLGNVKKQKQFNYAEQKNIAFLVEIGADEIASQKFRLRNAKTRETQNDLSIQAIIEILRKEG